ncbi:unnamed protein product [Parajaminaea phylloscopi]
MFATVSSQPDLLSPPLEQQQQQQGLLATLSSRIGALTERPELLLFLGALAAVLHSVISYLIWGPPERVKRAREARERKQREQAGNAAGSSGAGQAQPTASSASRASATTKSQSQSSRKR